MPSGGIDCCCLAVPERLTLLFDISHLLQIRLVAPEVNVDHGIGIYKSNKVRFADPFIPLLYNNAEF